MPTLMFETGGRMGDVILKSRPQTLHKADYLDAMVAMIDRKVQETDPDYLWEVTQPVLRTEGLDLTVGAPGLTLVEHSLQFRRAMGLDLVEWPVERPKLESGVGPEDLENLPLMEWLAPLYRETPPRTAGEAAASAAQNIGGSWSDLAQALGAIYRPNPNRLNSGPAFDEET